MANVTVGHHEQAPGGYEFKWGRAGLAVAVAGALFGTYAMGRTSAENSSERQTEVTAPVTPVRETETVQATAPNYSGDRMARARAELAEYGRLARRHNTNAVIIARYATECRDGGDPRPLEDCIESRLR